MMTIAKTKFWTPPPPLPKLSGSALALLSVTTSTHSLVVVFLSRIIGDIGKQEADEFLYIVDRLKELIKYKAFQVAPASLEDILLRHVFCSNSYLVVVFLSCVIGDIGKQDADGFLYIVDRLKELIKYKAFQVAPASLEDILLRHESVADAGVVGIPDEAAGELPRAYVVKRPGTQVTEKDIQDFVAGMEATLDFSCAGFAAYLASKKAICNSQITRQICPL